MLAYLPHVSGEDWSLYDEDDYIVKMYVLYIHSIYISDINNVASNPRYSRHYAT